MTVIAWDGKTLAADKQFTNCGRRGTTTKIWRADNGHLLASSGDLDQAREMIAWYNRGADPAKFPEKQRDPTRFAPLLVITPAGIALYECTPYASTVEDDYHAMGSGRDYALATMCLGHDAKRAVEVACVFEVGCGMGIDTLTLES